ncbi:sulfhydryl oxidase 1 [Eurytemora carolleeae]|uniref:sulfhydryl oxidase 1 n=1 Tax=Eurytemora carolleeae TaxID=1294199 RepID=UPI000C788EB2|nr:sulfhydryl oxidase 1 [Eurytemora carolleeae]|eukprot:XP_023332063.1 sulfhydryl oxidase 1-like [Eurytemora affinis]
MKILTFTIIFWSFEWKVECGLYESDSEVISLNATTFTDAITSRPHAWIVEFYASWCGHCQEFAQPYKQFSNDIAFWGDILRVGAIDCADPANEDTCSKYEVKGYPTVKYFPPYATEQDLGILRESYEKSVASLKYDSIDFIESVPSFNNSLWPVFQPITEYNELTDWSQVSEDRELFIIFEDESSYAGREVLMDIRQAFQGAENVARIVISENSTSALKLEISEFPALGFIAEASNELNVLKQGISADEIESLIYDHYNPGSVHPTRITGSVINPFQKDKQDLTKYSFDDNKNKLTVSLADLEKTVVYALLHEVPMKGEISGERFIALKDFVQILVDFFPQTSVLYPILEQLTFLQESKVLENLRTLVGSWDGFYERASWKSCKGSEPQFRGYPCGQWMLWHSLTVAQYLEDWGSPDLVLRAMLQYIKHFFSCTECSRHFVNMTADGNEFNQLATYQDAIIYLWEKHNSVNERLKNQATEDPHFSKEVFPSIESCPLCYNKNGSFSLSDVRTFLVNMYGDLNVENPTSSGVNLYFRNQLLLWFMYWIL